MISLFVNLLLLGATLMFLINALIKKRRHEILRHEILKIWRQQVQSELCDQLLEARRRESAWKDAWKQQIAPSKLPPELLECLNAEK